MENQASLETQVFQEHLEHLESQEYLGSLARQPQIFLVLLTHIYLRLHTITTFYILLLIQQLGEILGPLIIHRLLCITIIIMALQ